MIATADSFRYKQEIHQLMGGLDPVLTWCRSECQGEWRWSIVEFSGGERPGCYCFYFDNDRDACAFTLRWS